MEPSSTSSCSSCCCNGSALIGVVQVGLGPIGQRMARDVLQRKDMKLVGVVDVDPSKVGRDLSEIVPGARPGIKVSHPDDLPRLPGDVCLVTTVSKVSKIAPLIRACLLARKNVVSTCEELSFPWEKAPEVAASLDSLARQNGLVVLSTGINPGFLMDSLPLMLSGLMQEVTKVTVERHQDSRIRRVPFQKKIGAGLEPEEWKKLADSGVLKHVGFGESVGMIARALGWKLERVEERMVPVIAERDASSEGVKVRPGQCAGVRQTAVGFAPDGSEKVVLEMVAYNGLENPHDTVRLDGKPQGTIVSTIKGGVNGDMATSAILLNAMKSAISSPRRGLLTMLDIPLPHN